MSRRARRTTQEACTVPAGVTAIVASDGTAHTPATVRDTGRTLATDPSPLVAIALGNLKDGRHVAVEIQVRGREVVGGTVLCASPYAGPAARAWEQCAYLRLGCGAPYGDLEQAANARDGAGVAVADLSFAVAVAMPQHGRRFAATTMEIDGMAVSEPKVLCVDDRLTAWSNVASWAAQNLLPRRR